MRKLGIISFVIGIVSFILQMNEVFPGHEEILKVISYTFIGVVVGITISGLSKTEITFKRFSKSQTFVYFYYGTLGLIFLVLLLSIIFSTDKEKTAIYNQRLTQIGTFAVLSVVFGWVKFGSSDDNLTIDEKIFLADRHLQRKNFSTSLYYYYSILDALEEYDVRYKNIQEKIDEIKIEQLNNGEENKKLT